MTGPRLGARLWWGVIPLVVLVWGVGALAQASLPGLPQTPLVTLALVPIVGFARDISLALTLGALAILIVVPDARVRRWAIGWGAVGIGLVLLGLAVLRADVEATTILAGDAGADLSTLVTSTWAGRALAVAATCLGAAVVVSAVTRGRAGRWVALGLAAVAGGAPGFAGHAGLSGPHAAAGASIAAHVVAASVWIGGLAVVSTVMLIDDSMAPRMLPRYSTIALVCVIVVAESGLLTATLTAGTLEDLLGSTYGSLVLAKAVGLVLLIRLGWAQRRRAVDLLPSASVPVTVARIAGIELLVMGVAVAAAVVLARIGPPPIPGAGLAPLTVVALGLGLPMVLQWGRAGGWRLTNGLPEATAVVFLVVVVEVAGVGLLRELLGPLGLMIEVALLVGVGWATVAACRTALVGTLILAIGLPLALAVVVRLADDGWSARMAVVAVLAAEALLLAWRRAGRAVVQPVVDALAVAG